jgi:protein gp37
MEREDSVMTEQHDPLNPNTRAWAPRDEKEEHRRADRFDDPRRVPAAVRLLSCEPLLGPLARLRQVR